MAVDVPVCARHFPRSDTPLTRAHATPSPPPSQDRYGCAAARLVDLLLERGSLDEKTACEMAMMPTREGRETLYALTAAGVLAVQEVPKRPDHLPLYTYFLFRADFSTLLSAAVEEAHTHLINLRLRRRLEMGRLRATCADSDGALVTAGGGGTAPAAVVADGDAVAGAPSLAGISAGGPRALLPAVIATQSAGVAKLFLSELRLDAHLFLVRDLHWRLWPRKYSVLRNATAGVPFGAGLVGEFQPPNGQSL